MATWDLFNEDNGRFRIILSVVLVVFCALGAIVSLITIPELDRKKQETAPPRLAKVLLEKQQKRALPPPPPPKQVEKKPKAETEQAQKEVAKTEQPKPPENIKKPPPEPKVVKKQQIRNKVAKVGLLALADELLSLDDASVLKRLSRKDKPLVKTAKASANRPTLTTKDKVSKASEGISTARLTSKTESTQLAQREGTVVKASIETGGDDRRQGNSRVATRTIEELQLAIERQKRRFDFLYQKELRRNPALRGTVLFELTIAPSGKVTKCQILSSELNAPALERKLRIKMKAIDFGQKDVPTIIVEYPLNFLPA